VEIYNIKSEELLFLRTATGDKKTIYKLHTIIGLDIPENFYVK